MVNLKSLPQCTEIICHTPFHFRVGGKGRHIQVKIGARFWKTSSRTSLVTEFARTKGNQTRYQFDDNLVDTYFMIDKLETQAV